MRCDAAAWLASVARAWPNITASKRAPPAFRYILFKACLPSMARTGAGQALHRLEAAQEVQGIRDTGGIRGITRCHLKTRPLNFFRPLWSPRSSLEAVLSVPTQVGRVWPQFRSVRYAKRSIRAYQFVQVVRYPVRREDDAEVIAEGHQAAIEQPVRGAGEGDAVADGIRSIRLDGADVSGLYFRASAAVDEAQPGDCAGVSINGAHLAPKAGVTHFPCRECLHDGPRDVLGRLLRDGVRPLPRLRLRADAP